MGLYFRVMLIFITMAAFLGRFGLEDGLLVCAVFWQLLPYRQPIFILTGGKPATDDEPPGGPLAAA